MSADLINDGKLMSNNFDCYLYKKVAKRNKLLDCFTVHLEKKQVT